MKKIVAITLCLIANLSFATGSEEHIIKNCWDSTFAYKVATLVKNGDTFEIGVAGSWLFNKPESIVDISGIPLSATSKSRIFVSFAASECEQKMDGTLICKAKAPSS